MWLIPLRIFSCAATAATASPSPSLSNTAGSGYHWLLPLVDAAALAHCECTYLPHTPATPFNPCAAQYYLKQTHASLPNFAAPLQSASPTHPRLRRPPTVPAPPRLAAPCPHYCAVVLTCAVFADANANVSCRAMPPAKPRPCERLPCDAKTNALSLPLSPPSPYDAA
ncbi:hypothetical protein B0H19DRAFT_1275451 [Mycena capillaripes]|nr:hypothetical protein B0H19DRAFT_1275451 [Mycena capillaripes]